ncbi:hypothetical protein Chor_005000 [Crotalus horridus]
MSCYVPAYAVPTCRPTYASSSSSPVCYPVSGLGSLSSGGGAVSSGGGGGGGSITAASLGTVSGANIGCICQTPPSEILIQPSPVSITLPGPILTASCEPVRVGGYTACATGSSGRTSRSMMTSIPKYHLGNLLEEIIAWMSCCAPSCAVPICVPASSPPVCYPVGGLGSLTSCGVGGTYGLGSAGSGGAVSAATLGMTSGASMSCVNQIPPSELLIQPAPVNVVIPGAILSSTCEPIRVGGYTACATGMSCCAPSCAVPICVPASSPPVCYPVGGLGSLTSCGVGGTYGLGSAGSGGAVSAATLGMTSGASMSCVNQIPPSELLIQPAPVNVVIPGAILSSTCEPIRVGGYTACATGGPVSTFARYIRTLNPEVHHQLLSASPIVSFENLGLGSAGGGLTAASLGLAHGASVSCLNQIPPSEIVLQPAPINVIIPGAILPATCEPIRVGGYTACATRASSSSGGGSRLRYYPCIPCSPCRN